MSALQPAREKGEAPRSAPTFTRRARVSSKTKTAVAVFAAATMFCLGGVVLSPHKTQARPDGITILSSILTELKAIDQHIQAQQPQ